MFPPMNLAAFLSANADEERLGVRFALIDETDLWFSTAGKSNGR